MIHFSPIGLTGVTVCGKLIGSGRQLYTENERLTECDECKEMLGLHTENLVQEKKKAYDKYRQ